MYPKTPALNLGERNHGHTAHRPGIVWLQGEDNCGLAVIAVTLEHVLSRQGYNVTLLDHDQINNGLCRDLSTSQEDRYEYARRVAQTAKLFDDSNILTIVMVDSISPTEEDCVRETLSTSTFSHVYIQFPEADQNAADNLSDFQCPSQPTSRSFQKPENPELHLDATLVRSEDLINALLEHLDNRGSLQQGYSALASAQKKPKPNAVNETPISIAAG